MSRAEGAADFGVLEPISAPKITIMPAVQKLQGDRSGKSKFSSGDIAKVDYNRGALVELVARIESEAVRILGAPAR